MGNEIVVKKNYSLYANTLLFLNDAQTKNHSECFDTTNRFLNIPASVEGILVENIGNKTICNMHFAEEMEFPSTVKRVGKENFSGCNKLKRICFNSVPEFQPDSFSLWNCKEFSEVVFRNVSLSAQAYEELKKNCLHTADGLYVPLSFPETIFPETLKVLGGTSYGYAFVDYIPRTVRRLFLLDNETQQDRWKNDFFARKLSCIDFVKKRRYCTEEEAFFDCVLHSQSEERFQETEWRDDMAFRDTSIRRTRSPLYIITFNDKATKTENGRCLVTFSFLVRTVFWQSSAKVFVDGKIYYVYRRHYARPDGCGKFERRDMAVYGENGLVTDRNEAIKVYEKYRLLSLL